MKKRNLFKSVALALSISLLAPFASRATAQETTSQFPNIIAESALVMDMDTGEVIASKNADVKLSPASTTKLMTALIFAENKSKSDTITFTEDAVKVTETSLINFKPLNVGDKISAQDVMEAVMIFSANDTAYLMADSVAGSVDAFVQMMNDRAKALGLENTHFVNPSGLEQDPLTGSTAQTNLTTAYDLAVIAKEAFKNDWVRETMSPENKEVTVDLTGSPLVIESRNKILGKNGNIGGKTGTEDQAGHCFVGFFNRNGRNLITVALKSEYGADGINVFNDTETLADYGYNAQKQVYKKAGEEVGTANLEYKIFRFFGPTKTIEAPIVASEDIMYYKNDINDAGAKIEYLNTDSNAWKVSGEDLNITFSLPNHAEEIKGTINISSMDLIKSNISFYLAFILILVIIIILVFVIIRILNMKKRRRRY
ncbi:D-alanyl-D-alanine carboxypeptidase family protein [Clostridium sp.]|uniref:D-alanyl-D-alanine carboxypeptidase family protein n=1 Tax=Clostridium sp. TaxID=1506 RepID=UPI003F3DC3F2